MDTSQNTNPQSTPGTMNSDSTMHKNNTAMGILAYIGPLVIIPWLTVKDDPFVKFHVRQGLVLLVIEVAVWILGTMMWQFWAIWNLVNLAVFVLAIIGIINVSQGKQKELPVVGSFGSHFKI